MLALGVSMSHTVSLKQNKQSLWCGMGSPKWDAILNSQKYRHSDSTGTCDKVCGYTV